MMLTSTPMPAAVDGKKLVVVKGSSSSEGSGMEVREVDRSTDLLVFGANGSLQTREGQFFGADKSGRNGVTYRLHFVMQRDTAELDAEESHRFREHFTRRSLEFPSPGAALALGARSTTSESESATSRFGAKHRTSIVGSIVESVEDNLLHAFLDAEDASELQVHTDASANVDIPPPCCPWFCRMFLKYAAACRFPPVRAR